MARQRRGDGPPVQHHDALVARSGRVVPAPAIQEFDGEGGGRPAEVFEGHGYYRLASASATEGTGTWIDSRGVIFPVTVTVTADALTSDWGNPSTERGRTVYRLADTGGSR